MSLLKQDVEWVDSDERLEAICNEWEGASLLAVDTEFMRSRTYYPIAGLIQVNDGQKNYLIDPLEIKDFQPLVEVFDNPDIVKVLHSCSEDLEVFQHTLACLPKGLIDTQILAAITGHVFSIGFGNLVAEELDIELPKSETRSDWLQRPLSESQVTYAALDVEYLYPLAAGLLKKAKELQRLEWAKADSQLMVDNFFANQDPDRSYLRFKSAWKLNENQLASLQFLSRWREDQAQSKNVPRNRIIKDAALFTLALKAPKQLGQLRKVEGLTERMARCNGEHFLNLIDKAQQLPEDELPELLPHPLNAQERDVLSGLKEIVAKKAEALSVPVEVLARKKDYESLLVSVRMGKLTLPVGLSGWRQDVIGNTLLDALKEE